MELSLPPATDRFPLHRRVLEAASRAGRKDPTVLGMLIGGSVASGEADDFSDLDLQLVVKDGQVEKFAPKLRALAAEAGPVVAAFYAEHVGLPQMLIVLYEDLIHADFEPVEISGNREERPSSARRAESRMGLRQEGFAATVPGLTRESAMNALKSSIHLYLELAGLLQKKFSIAPADEARRVVLQALEQSP